MKIKKNKSQKPNIKKKHSKKLKKKIGSTKKSQKIKSKKTKEENKKNIIKKSTFSYSLKKYQNLPLREKMLEKLKSSRFRYINEELYNMKGKDALKYFQNNSEAFMAYHEGYNKQTQSWPKNPVDIIIQSLTQIIDINKNITIGDFGCGDAKIARSLEGVKVFSFDLVSLDPNVTVCDMAHTPLDNGSLDVAVFCLSLMGTNFSDYLIEANRVLKTGGTLKIAEVESRFVSVEDFIKTLSRFGFSIISKNFKCQLFCILDFKKERNLGKNFKKRAPHLTLKPCLYKKR